MPAFLGYGNQSVGALNLSTYTPLQYSATATTGSNSISCTGSFNTGDIIRITQMRGTNAGQTEEHQVASYTTGTITTVHPLTYTYTDSGASQAQVIVVPQASVVTGTLTVPAWDGNVGGIFQVKCGVFNGVINANGKGFRGGASVSGVVGGSGQNGKQGEGYLAAGGTQSSSANGSGGGGGIEGEGGDGGGGGGYAVAGTEGGKRLTATGGGAGGLSAGLADLTSGIFMGGAGGSGGGEANDNLGPHLSGAGGNGGGIIIVDAINFLNTAELYSNGSNGGVGGKSDDGSGSGGGGAGGTILVRSISPSIGSSKVTASAGTGGAAIVPQCGKGGNGSVGRIRIESCSLSGTTSPTASTQTGGHAYCGTNIAIL